MKDLLLIQKAKKFSEEIHKGNNRKSGESYHDHCLRVHEKLKKADVKDKNILISSLLHHALPLSSELGSEIEKLFGKEVHKILRNYKKMSDTHVDYHTKSGLNNKYIVQAYMNLSKDIRVILIRVADKADNIETAFALGKKQRKEVAERALYIYAPICRLLELEKFTRELENGAFKVLNPRQYYTIDKAIMEQKPRIEKFFKDTKPALVELLKEQGIDSKIGHRIKHVYGVFRKIPAVLGKGKKIGKDFSGVYDMAAMRILVDTVEQCYQAEGILKDLWKQVLDARDDYIQNPKASGYKSIHNHFETNKGFMMEVQIRTSEMEEKSRYGSATHVLYKIGSKFNKSFEKNPNWLKDLAQWKREKEFGEKESTITQFNDNVYVFTPKGDIIKLQKGSTIIDFAYAIHSSVGNKCTGASVNGQIEKLSCILQDGDRVEVKTLRSKSKPSPGWLEIAKTKKAKSAIKKALYTKK